MALDRHSLREDFDAYQKTFERLRKEGEMSPAAIALVRRHAPVLMKLMIALFLEKTTKKTNRNSGLPSSQVDKDETSKERSGSTGKGPGQEKTATDNTRFVTVDDTVTVEACEHCGEDLTSTPSSAPVRSASRSISSSRPSSTMSRQRSSTASGAGPGPQAASPRP